jgi:phosphatidylglycerol:prolipoprotein diacylglycerol transferase
MISRLSFIVPAGRASLDRVGYWGHCTLSVCEVAEQLCGLSKQSLRSGQMYPILTRFGPFFLYSYTVLIGLGIALGIGMAAGLERRGDQRIPGWFDGMLVALVAGVAGGRAVFVALNWTYYRENIQEIVLLSRGGLSYYGVLVTGLLALWFWTLWRRRSFGPYGGLLAPSLALVSVFGWLACWLEGCAFGRETIFGPLAADLPDSFGVDALRFQTQLMSLIICLLVVVIVLGLRGRLQPLLIFWLTLLFLSAGRIVVSFFRGDKAPIIGQYRLDTMADGVLIVVSLLAIIIIARRWQRQGSAHVGLT